MKNIYLLLFVFLSYFSFGQTYYSFPDSNAIWREHYTDDQGANNHYQFGIIGDTIINSLLYHKIYYEPNCLSDTIMTKNNSSLIGGIREDSLKRVFFYNIAFSDYVIWTSVPFDSIYKLYDFSVQIGDTVKFQSPLALPVYAYPYLVLDSIDSVFTYDHYRKLYHLSGESWIEGIGSLRSLFSAIIQVPTCYCSWENVCYDFNSITYYLNPPYLDCYDMTENISENKQDDKNIIIYPNPIISIGTIDFSKLSYKIFKIEIFNILGEKIKDYRNLESQKLIIDRTEFNPGLYIYKLTSTDQNSLNGKFLIE